MVIFFYYCKLGHGIESDIWAIGCMLYAMLFGNPPFETEVSVKFTGP